MANNYRNWTVRFWDISALSGINLCFGNSISWNGKARTQAEAIRKAENSQAKKGGHFGNIHSAYPHYSEKELFDWMMAQSSNRPVDMGNGHLDDCIPCLMGAFLKEKGFKIGAIRVEGDLRVVNTLSAQIDLTREDIFDYFDNSMRNRLRDQKTLDETFYSLQQSFIP